MWRVLLAVLFISSCALRYQGVRPSGQGTGGSGEVQEADEQTADESRYGTTSAPATDREPPPQGKKRKPTAREVSRPTK